MNTSNRIGWGILGGARINERMLPAIVNAPNSELIAVASRRPGAAAETLKKYAPAGHAAVCYDALQALLNDERVQVVYVPMANHEHAEWTLQALAHGKHVLCEKPLALTTADIDAIEAAAKQAGKKVMEGFMYRFHPQHGRVRAILDSGAIGEIRSVRASFSFMMRPARLYRLADDVSRGGGAMWDIGCYAIHCLRQFFPELPRSVTALANFTDSGADNALSGVLAYGEDRFGHFDISFNRARRCEYELIGTKGGLRCAVVWQLPGDTPVIQWWTEDGRQTEERLPAANHFELEIEHFSRCVLEDGEPGLSLSDAKDNCRVINAVLESAASGQPALL